MAFFSKVRSLLSKGFNDFMLLYTDWGLKPYDFYMLFGKDEENTSPWIETIWQKDVEPYIDQILALAQGQDRIGIRVFKYQSEIRTTKDGREFVYHVPLKLGRLGWNTKSHKKWTLHNNTDQYFSNFELVFPYWKTCEKRGSPHDIFISIKNEYGFVDVIKPKFGYIIVIAIAKRLKLDVKGIIRDLSKSLDTKITVVKSRCWGAMKGKDWNFINAVPYTFSNGIYKNDNIHNFNFSELKFEPFWEVIYKSKY